MGTIHHYVVSIAVAPLNHLLRQNSWALTHLKPFAGKIIGVRHPLFELDFMISENGEIREPAAGSELDATLKFSMVQGVRAALRDKAVFKEIETQGDAELLSVAIEVIENINWDIEEDLSKFIGDIAAHRLTSMGKKTLEEGKKSVENLARSLVEYLTEERPLLAKPGRVKQVSSEIDAIRRSVSDFEQRLDRLLAEASKRRG